MSTMKRDQKNGKENKAMENVQAPLAKPQAEAKQQSTAKVSLEERIQRVEEKRPLTGKRSRTIETLNHLQTFRFGRDDSGVLIIQDCQGHKFQTGNSNLLSSLKDYLQVTLNGKASTLDDEIMRFSL